MRPLVFVNRFAAPDDSATAQLLSDLSSDLVQRGHRVTVIASRQLYRKPNADLEARETRDGVEIRRLWSTNFGRQELVGRAIDYLTFYLSLAFYLTFQLPWRAVLVTLTDPPLMTVVTWLPSFLKGVRQVHWSQDVFPEIVSAVQRPARVARIALRFLQVLRNLSLRPRMHVVAISEDMRAHFICQGLAPEAISVLPNWSSGDTVFPVDPEDNPLRKAWGLDHAFVLGYSGNLGRVHDYDTFLSAAKLLVDRLPKIRFLFIGSGALHDKMRTNLPDELKDYTIFQPYQDRSLLSQSLSVPDVHWISLQPDCTPLVFPSKFYGVMAAGRPAIFVGEPSASLSRVLEHEGVGISVAQGNGSALADAVKVLAEKPELRATMGQRAHALFHGHYEQSLALGRWARLLDRMGTSESLV